ncbi:MAG: hypothetical protein IT423_07230 [Pirellulaceae bacterium]|nr:hypothetical protein [Pirellulaceae bacterium]
MSEYILVDKTQQLIRGFFAVQNDVGLGRNEEVYQRAFEIWTSEERLPIVSKPPVQLLIRDQVAHTLDRVHVQRRIFDPVESALTEDFSFWTNHIDGPDPKLGSPFATRFIWFTTSIVPDTTWRSPNDCY